MKNSTALYKFLDPKNDYAFKRVFGTEKNKDILLHFLNDVLCPVNKIQSVTLLKPIQDPEALAKKQSIVDVLCVDELNVQYIVEMQVVKTQGFEKRAQYYAAKAYISQMNKGNKYENLKEVIFLAITDFTLFPNKKAYMSDHVILDKETFEQDLKDFSFTFIELKKFNKSIDELNTMLEKWCYFFKYADETSEAAVQKVIGNHVVLERAFSEINQLTWTENELKLYERELKSERDLEAMLSASEEKGRAEGHAKGHEEGHAKGHAEGRTAGRIEGGKDLLLNLLKQKFGTVPNNYQIIINLANDVQIMQWAGRVLKYNELEAIFSNLKEKEKLL